MKITIIFTILFSLLFASVEAATVPAAAKRSFPDSSLYNAISKLLDRNAPGIKGGKLRWHQKVQVAIIQKKWNKHKMSTDGGTKTATKVLSVLSLVLGALAVASLFVGFGGILLLSLGALITGVIGLSNNKSKKHKTMAILGVVLSGVVLIVVLAVILAFASIFS